jgi:hypothetical protein
MQRTILVIGIFLITAMATAGTRAADRVLVVGIDHYKVTGVGDTPGSEADATAMADLMKRKYHFAEGTVHKLVGSDATADKIRFEIQTWLINGTNPGDRVFFFYSGHGSQVDDDNHDEADELDEVLAPYDVYPGDKNTPPSHFIRDDEINIFLLGLSGRRVVMAFDSCHSGTISRSLTPKSKFLAMKNKFTPMGSTRGFGDTESYVPKEEKNKDLHTVTENIIDKKLNGVVIYSAATSYQTAAWLKDGSRGAFAYSFEMVQQQDGYYPTAGEIQQKLTAYLGDLKDTGRVSTLQTPEMEIISETPLENKPLFGVEAGNADTSSNWEASFLPALHNPLADFRVKLNIDRNVFSVGDELRYSVKITGLKQDEEAYLYILVFSVDDSGKRHVTSLFPTKSGNDMDNKITNGDYGFPRTGRSGVDYRTTANGAGKDTFVALVSKKKISSLGDQDEYKWDEVLKLIGIEDLKKKVAEATRSFSNQNVLRDGDWQASAEIVRVK